MHPVQEHIYKHTLGIDCLIQRPAEYINEYRVPRRHIPRFFLFVVFAVWESIYVVEVSL